MILIHKYSEPRRSPDYGVNQKKHFSSEDVCHIETHRPAHLSSESPARLTEIPQNDLPIGSCSCPLEFRTSNEERQPLEGSDAKYQNACISVKRRRRAGHSTERRPHPRISDNGANRRTNSITEESKRMMVLLSDIKD